LPKADDLLSGLAIDMFVLSDEAYAIVAMHRQIEAAGAIPNIPLKASRT